MISQPELDFFIDNNRNVLFEGEHGVGKTSMIFECFKRHNLNFKYLSGSTLDPWVDFVGVPKELEDANGELYLGLVRPQDWAKDEVEALFIDEYNRAPKKVRNAVMELIQFKSINGKKFNKLRFVWVAINPEDSDTNEYDVEPLDPAQKDRFHCHVYIPNKPSYEYFRDKFSDKVATEAINWWNGLSTEVQTKVSPRRLDYALEIVEMGGNVNYVLPKESNPKILVEKIGGRSIKDILFELQKSQDEERIKKWFANDNNLIEALPEVTKRTNYIAYFMPFMPEEHISRIIGTNEVALNVACQLYDKNDLIKEIVDNIIENGGDQEIVDKLKMNAFIPGNGDSAKVIADKIRHNDNSLKTKKIKKSNSSYKSVLKKIEKSIADKDYAKVFDLWDKEMARSLDKEETARTLSAIETYINNVQDTAIQRKGVERFVTLINYLCENAENNGIKVTDMFDKYPNIMRYAVDHKSGGSYYTVS